jgi:hypothetical protein
LADSFSSSHIFGCAVEPWYCPFNFISRQSSNQKEPGNKVGKAGLKDNGEKNFIVYIKSVTSCLHLTMNMILILCQTFLFRSYMHVISQLTVNFYIVRHLALYSRKIIFWVTWRKWQGRIKTTIIVLYGVYRDLIRFLKKLMLLSFCNGNYIHENQVGEVLSYQYEPEVGEKQAIL